MHVPLVQMCDKLIQISNSLFPCHSAEIATILHVPYSPEKVGKTYTYYNTYIRAKLLVWDMGQVVLTDLQVNLRTKLWPMY